ncbi:MAG TPA: hypothetical protein P5279_02965 [Anaerohalosphaeraceae bacterium]|nr:hypothetical protein [Anaerohalosphaeraceae bacterium]HRT49430.1 hypothetical protein [Anaerohalosphaeraceae bacterium]HRT85406.1 hypothetical protein [Anaerohalosphaeraceae bacterium]
MQRYAQTAITCLIAAALLIIAGCNYVDEPIVLDTIPARPAQTYTAPPAVVQPTDAAVAKRFTETKDDAPDAVESAVMWSEKYKELAEKYKTLTEENMALVKENSDLKKNLLVLEADLKRTRQELDDANAFLHEMHAELTQWKGDVLGFRDEIRTAQSAQLQALAKILKLLGAETTEPIAMTTPETVQQ